MDVESIASGGPLNPMVRHETLPNLDTQSISSVRLALLLLSITIATVFQPNQLGVFDAPWNYPLVVATTLCVCVCGLPYTCECIQHCIIHTALVGVLQLIHAGSWTCRLCTGRVYFVGSPDTYLVGDAHTLCTHGCQLSQPRTCTVLQWLCGPSWDGNAVKFLCQTSSLLKSKHCSSSCKDGYSFYLNT